LAGGSGKSGGGAAAARAQRLCRRRARRAAAAASSAVPHAAPRLPRPTTHGGAQVLKDESQRLGLDQSGYKEKIKGEGKGLWFNRPSGLSAAMAEARLGAAH
jgi:hypothetical protein